MNQHQKIEKSDSFLPAQVSVYKTVFYLKVRQIKENKNVTKYGNKLETSCQKFPTIFYQMEPETWRKILGYVMLTPGG